MAAYCRVSTDSDEQQNSYDNQVEYYTDYIKARPEWDFAGIYADEGTTGTNTRRRTQFNKLIEDAMAGKIDYIVTKAISRFARNTLDCLTYVRQLKERQIGVFFEKENIDTLDSKSEVILTILASVAQDESRNTSENVKWNIQKRFKEGKPFISYGNFLGYRKGKDGQPEIVEAEAETIRLIYKLFLEGMPPTAIAAQLAAEGRKTARGGTNWQYTNIRSILTNEKYCGDAILQKKYTPDFLTKKQVVNDGFLPQYHWEDTHPAIVSRDVFYMVQAEIKRRTETGGTGKHPLAGRLRCAECGGTYGSKVWHSNTPNRKIIWRCNDKYKVKGQPCPSPSVDEETVYRAFVDMFNSIFDEKETIIAAMESVMTAIDDTGDARERLDALTAERDALVNEARELIRQNASGAISTDEYVRQYQEMDTRHNRLQEERRDIEEVLYDAVSRKVQVKFYLEALKQQDGVLTEFDDALWRAVVDTTTIGNGKITFTLKDGTAVEWDI